MRRIYSEDCYVLCPFYQKEDSKKIYCEGLAKGCDNAMVFANSSRLLSFKKKYCYTKYQTCPLHDALMDKYV